MSLLNRKSPPDLAEQIEAVKAKIEEFIDTKVAEVKKTAVNVPDGVIRATLTARSQGCACRAYTLIKDQA